jgi:hypothetical protein
MAKRSYQEVFSLDLSLYTVSWSLCTEFQQSFAGYVVNFFIKVEIICPTN